jgi:hypothetical protein
MAVRLLALPLLLAAVALPGARSAQPRDLVPDLDQSPPGGLAVVVAGTPEAPSFRLAFGSAVENAGRGPLIVRGHRASRDEPRMVADQLVLRSDGTYRRIRGVGVLRYVISPDHQHWHYLGFDRYELRRAADFSLVVRDRKTGFCLGDRYRIVPGVGDPMYVGRCALKAPGRLRVEEGINPGFGDNYTANLEGQYLDVTGVPAGDYVLVHRVNADGALLEADPTNDAASVLLSIAWPNGTGRAPAVVPKAVCPDTEVCPG